MMNVLKRDKGYLIGNATTTTLRILSMSQSVGKHDYSVMRLNMQDIPRKFDYLKMMLHGIETYGKISDFLLLCETFLTDKNVHMYNISGYNFIYRNRTNSNRGGVAMYIKYGFEYCERPDIIVSM